MGVLLVQTGKQTHWLSLQNEKLSNSFTFECSIQKNTILTAIDVHCYCCDYFDLLWQQACAISKEKPNYLLKLIGVWSAHRLKHSRYWMRTRSRYVSWRESWTTLRLWLKRRRELHSTGNWNMRINVEKWKIRRRNSGWIYEVINILHSSQFCVVLNLAIATTGKTFYNK